MHAGAFHERDLLKQTTMTITVQRGPFQPYLMRFGLWVMMVGARIAGIGHIDVEGL
jgi:hypothetical protein